MTGGRRAASGPAGAGRLPRPAAAGGGRPSRTAATDSGAERTGAAPARRTARQMRKCHFIEAQLALAQGPRPGGGRRSHAAHAGQGEPEPALGSVVAGQRRPRGGRDGQAAAAATAAAALPVLGVRAPPQGPPARPARAAPGFVALAQQGPLQQRLRRRRRRRRPRPRARARLRARPRRARETDQGAAPARSAGQHLPVPGRARQARRPGGEELVAQPGPPPALVELQPLALQVPLALRGEEDPQPQPLAVAQENPGPGQGRRRPRKARRGRGRPRPAPLPQLLAHPQAAPGLAQLHGAAAHHQCPKASHPLLPAQPLVLLQLPEQRLLKPEPQPQPQSRSQPRKLQQPQPRDPQPHAQPLPDPQSQLPQPEQLREWGLLSPDRPSLVPPGIGRGEGSGPRTREGACTPLLQGGPRAREDLECGRPADKEELGSAASRGSPPPPPACPPCPGNKEPLRTQGSPCPPSCLMPAHQAGDSSVDPGTPRKVPDLEASRTHSTGPLAPFYQRADEEVGWQAGSKLDRRKNDLTLGASPSKLGSGFLLSWLQDPG
ncbi:serine/arginine repetitive matrix protein 3 isoform X4 [Neofelis nebulosa]|uniref:serine/arginine repetitive matrix protein 3 isoform X4 n=1 Tax=Neofelis nebulosa TaxID=61452 RepID=UPI00272A3010|nr:serine/arginine repetitive matrix protein 3 isoform X4 [Neofelis nebulosa]